MAYKAEEVAKAITDAKGLITVAAKRLGCSPNTIYAHIEKNPTVKQAMEDARAAMTDFAESALYAKIQGGDTTAIIFYLKTQGKKRGYVERQEFTGADGDKLTVRVIYDDN